MWDWAVSSDCMIKWGNPAVQIVALLPLLFLFLPLIFLLEPSFTLRCEMFMLFSWYKRESHRPIPESWNAIFFQQILKSQVWKALPQASPAIGPWTTRTRTSRCLGGYSLGIPMTQWINIGYGARELGRPCGFWMLLLCVLLHAYVPTWLVA